MENFFKFLTAFLAMTVSLMCIALNATMNEVYNLQQKVESLENTIYIEGGVK